MRARKVKLPLTLDTLRFLLGGKRPYTLGELGLSFGEDLQEVEELLRAGVALGALTYYPASRKSEARYAANVWYREERAARREPIQPEGELRYDLFVHARLARFARRS
ncbi:hypothetical protein [Paraburkholderia saeva]|jgi:hypothetical protein|uniref:Uncharacterized protein n=1 Tax=Paraburkholderia saeva TaxID=2777537 RepID=A0A9N8RXW9_9BURK|nr:hypothetical protein [Paraburkholderia saeva]CAG4900677.1 hypothetical protein LMG31841_02905 [Paraburkholderia saeva]